MANAKQPTQQMRHMDTKAFAIQDWIREEQMILQPIKTQNNVSNHFTKALGRIKFYKQTDILMGRRKPAWTKEPELTRTTTKHETYEKQKPRENQDFGNGTKT